MGLDNMGEWDPATSRLRAPVTNERVVRKVFRFVVQSLRSAGAYDGEEVARQDIVDAENDAVQRARAMLKATTARLRAEEA